MSARAIAGWVLSVLACPPFLFAAYLKFTNNPMEVGGFVLYGLPMWFMYVVGLFEVSGIAFLLFTKRPLIGAALLTVVGFGATFEHLTHAQFSMAPIPFTFAIFAILGALLRTPAPRSKEPRRT